MTERAAPTGRSAPRFFYGYTVVVAAFFIFMVSFGLLFSYGVFFKPLIAEFGWTRAMTSFAFSVNTVVSGVLGIAVGGLVDRYGPRRVMTVCGLLLGLGYLLMSQVHAFWHIILFFGVIAGLGMCGVWVSVMPSVSRWFVRRRSLMTGIVISGTGFGQLVAPPLVSRLIAAYDWRLAYTIVGVAVVVVVVLAAQLLRRDPEKMGLRPDGAAVRGEPGPEAAGEFSLRQAMATAPFWVMFLMFYCFGFTMFAFMVHIVPHATDLGIGAIRAANILAVMGGVSIIGNLAGGGVGDRIGNRRVFLIGFVLLAAVLLGLLGAGGVWLFYLLALVFGFATGGMGACEVPLIANIFGLRSLGLTAGVFSMAFTLGAATGPYVTGHIFDLQGSYQAAFLVVAACGVAAVVLVALLRPARLPEPRGS